MNGILAAVFCLSLFGLAFLYAGVAGHIYDKNKESEKKEENNE